MQYTQRGVGGQFCRLLDAHSGKVLGDVPGGGYTLADTTAFLPDNHLLLAPVSDYTTGISYAVLWDAAAGKEARRLTPRGRGWPRSVAASPDGRLALIGHAQGHLE